jgi:hypothetical protein
MQVSEHESTWGTVDEAAFRFSLRDPVAECEPQDWDATVRRLVEAALATKGAGTLLVGFGTSRWKSRANHPDGQALTSTYLRAVAQKARRKARESLTAAFMSRQRENVKPKSFVVSTHLPTALDHFTCSHIHLGRNYDVTVDIVSSSPNGEFVADLVFRLDGAVRETRSGVSSGKGCTFSALDGPRSCNAEAAKACAWVAAGVAFRAAASAAISACSAADAASDAAVRAAAHSPVAAAPSATASDPTDDFMASLTAPAVDPAHKSVRRTVHVSLAAQEGATPPRPASAAAVLRQRCRTAGLSDTGTAAAMRARLLAARPGVSPAVRPRAAPPRPPSTPFTGMGHLCTYKGTPAGAWGKGNWHDCLLQADVCARTGSVVMEHHDFGAAGTFRGDATLYALAAPAAMVGHGGGEWSWPGSRGDRIVLREQPRGGSEDYVFPKDGRAAAAATPPARKKPRGRPRTASFECWPRKKAKKARGV